MDANMTINHTSNTNNTWKALFGLLQHQLRGGKNKFKFQCYGSKQTLLTMFDSSNFVSESCQFSDFSSGKCGFHVLDVIVHLITVSQW